MVEYTLKELSKLKTIEQGHFDNLKISHPYVRVWLSRMTKADGMPYDNQVTVETTNAIGDWITIQQYQAV